MRALRLLSFCTGTAAQPRFSLGYPRLAPGSVTLSSMGLRIALSAPGNVTCAAFLRTAYTTVPPTPDTITGNVSLPRADLPLPTDPAGIDASQPILLGRCPPITAPLAAVEAVSQCILPSFGQDVRGTVVYCAAYAGAPCNNCSAAVSPPLRVQFRDGRPPWRPAPVCSTNAAGNVVALLWHILMHSVCVSESVTQHSSNPVRLKQLHSECVCVSQSPGATRWCGTTANWRSGWCRQRPLAQ